MESSTIDDSVVLDEKTGAVILPYDRFSTSMRDAEVFRVARTAAAAVCAKQQGVTFMVGRWVDQPVYDSEKYAGPWTMAQAEKFGFVSPMPDADLRANGVVGEDYGEPSLLNNAEVAAMNSQLTEEESAVVEACHETEEARQFAPSPEGPWAEELWAAADDLYESPEVTNLFAELGACHEDQGLGVHQQVPEWPAGADPTRIDAEQISLAIASVRCKESLDFTRRLAEIEAASQVEVLQNYPREVAAAGQEIADLRERAKAYIDAHPEVFEVP
ncbi:hypothetical protein [Antribacter gilvus]|uniref:hypothetical protein n=1 Tax=Antribacter gilvus TaxID=2304675 RepID=UPI000F78E9F9|nr:hypothetical protein [Antribacter gilvus]